jgi:DNA-binding transcriptional ArsR family regulator
MADKPRRDPVRIGMLTNALLMRHLVEGKMTRQQLADATGLHYITVSRYLHELRKQHILYVASWLRGTEPKAKAQQIFKLGAQPDVPKPAPLTAQERQARTRAKKRRIKQARALTGSLLSGREAP